jgi:hypothetical protein
MPSIAPPIADACAAYTVADLEPRSSGTDRDDFARPIRQRDQVGLGRGAGVLALDGDQVAVVERRRPHAHQHLARTGRRVGPFDQPQPIDAAGL